VRSMTRLALGLSLAVLGSKPASATFHEIMVKEVFPGTAAAPNAQYVMLQAWAQFQNAVGGHTLTVYDAAGVSVGTFTFAAPVGNSADQMTLFIATPQAATLFNLTADLAMTPVISPAGGKVCWETWDCVAWGNYTGPSAGVGTPFNVPVGLERGTVMRRRLDVAGNPTLLEGADDTNNTANDFLAAVPAPRTNPGVNGTLPASTCGNSTLEGLEQCDDGNTTALDGCSAVCAFESQLFLPAEAQIVDVPGLAAANGVLEPGETASFHTTWFNNASAAATLSGAGVLFGGPAGATYTLLDPTAQYSLPSNASAACSASLDCYMLGVSAPAVRPAPHWDAQFSEVLSNDASKTWAVHVGESFPDVPTGNPFYAFIENLFHNGVTGGCSGGNYCPVNPVTRGQMAVFLLKAKLGSAHLPPACVGTVFTDVNCSGPFDAWIEELASLNITGGCGGGMYCPGNTVTRGQMAVFLLKALEGSAYDPPDCAGVFQDVACTPGTGFSDWIEELYGRQITGGCNVSPLQYCPDNPNNRGQMAVFLVKTFSLLLYGSHLQLM
jgi:cysteine-rich repeat protein